MSEDLLSYPTVDEIHVIHEDIVEEGEETEPGIQNPRDVDSALHYISEGHYGKVPETIHEKAAHLLRMLVTAHPYVDGNKRTALAATEVFYAMNGYLFTYDGREIRQWLQKLATDADSVDMVEFVSYCQENSIRTGTEE
ncbi:type II toxin-antitoxin system death-on-curing family toxin [Natronobiforma cellulositropha]|uniref:type II toxin-antitoxin system death-on-curing family toxin n=1 Tax=Natronobiforma cellulositropha TaxID=1679076 RepID=UPI0021D5F7BD|nr:type II toxin-antitoxin system death-on-curing family toxin [Natronobiforma cellulositropha]